MDPEVVKLFGVMLAIMVPVAAGGGVFVLIASLAKRHRSGGIRPSSGSDDLSSVLDGIERLDLRMQQLEERLDFVERVLPTLREGAPASPARSDHLPS
jgi:hypothetical protein